MSGCRLAVRATSQIALANAAPSASDPVRKCVASVYARTRHPTSWKRADSIRFAHGIPSLVFSPTTLDPPTYRSA